MGQKELLAIVNNFERSTRDYLDLLQELAVEKVDGVQEKREQIAKSGALLRNFVKRHSLLGVEEIQRVLRFEVK